MDFLISLHRLNAEACIANIWRENGIWLKMRRFQRTFFAVARETGEQTRWKKPGGRVSGSNVRFSVF
jgi:hypothetical protein